MSKRIFDDWLREYVQYTQHSEAPDVFHFWTGVGTIAGALRRRVWIDQRYFQWTPNFYIFFVAPPGVVSKSTTAGIGIDLLRQVEGIHFGPDVVTWQALMTSLAEAQELVEMDDGLMHPMACVTVAASELGTFFNPQDREMVDVLVSLWDGQKGVFKKATKTQGSENIENPWLNILGCTTPAWLAANFPEYMIGGGFTSRSVFVYAHKKRQFIAYPAEAIDPQDHAELRAKLVHDLQFISDLKGEFKMSDEATEWGKRWYESHWSDDRPEHMTSDRFGGYLARKQTHIHKLAMILSVAQGDDLVISQQDLEMSAAFVSSLEADMTKVFESVGATTEMGHSKEVLSIIRGMKKIKRSDLWRKCMSMFKNSQEFDQSLQGLINAGFIKQSQIQDDLVLTYLGGAA